jgi:hypothetical protein
MPQVMKIRSLNLPDPQGPAQACRGKTLPLPLLCFRIFDNSSLELVKLLGHLQTDPNDYTDTSNFFQRKLDELGKGKENLLSEGGGIISVNAHEAMFQAVTT